MNKKLLAYGFTILSLSFSAFLTANSATRFSDRARVLFEELTFVSQPILYVRGEVAGAMSRGNEQRMVSDTLPPLRDRSRDFITEPNRNAVDLADPASVTQEVEYDPETGMYIVRERLGGFDFRPPTVLTFEEYQRYREQQQRDRYFKRLGGVGVGDGEVSIGDPLADIELDPDLVDEANGDEGGE